MESASASATAAAPMPARTGRCLRTTKFPKRSTTESIRLRLWRLTCPGAGSVARIAGSTVIENAQATMTPNALRFPSSLKGGESLKLRLKNPMAVVMLVRRPASR